MAKKRTYEELEQRVEELEREANEWKRAGERMERYVAELERSNEKLKKFIHVASRDLQEPLDEVMRYLRFVEARYKDRLDSDANAFIASAVEGATRMQKIMNDLLAYSSKGIRGGQGRSRD